VGDGDGRRRRREQTFEQHDGVDIEVVRGLVEQQQVGVERERERERRALAFSARQAVRHDVGIERETVEECREPRVEVPGIRRLREATARGETRAQRRRVRQRRAPARRVRCADRRDA
jgi:hypothetical protein